MVQARKPAVNKFSVFVWALYNWAHDSFPILITSFVFAAYFTKVVAVNETMAAVQWGWAAAAAGILTALTAPILGAMADITGKRKLPLALFSLLNVVCVALLWFTQPNHQWVIWALVFYAIASFGFEVTYVYYNAMLKSLVPKRLVGRISGWGWSCGYFGGVVSLLIAIFVLIKSNLIGHQHDYNVRAVTLFSAAWFLFFGWPLFVFIKDEKPQKRKSDKSVWALAIDQLITIFKEAKKYRVIFRFVIARLFYIDALNTTFIFAGIFASAVFHMTLANILLFGLSANITAGIGTVALSFVDDWLGPRFVIFWSIVVMLVADAIIFFAHSVSVFWVASLCLTFFSGAMQSASRSYLTHVAPKNRINQMFGLYALAGRSTSFIGPILASIFILVLNNVRWVIPAVFVLGLIGLLIFITLPSTKEPV